MNYTLCNFLKAQGNIIGIEYLYPEKIQDWEAPYNHFPSTNNNGFVTLSS